MHERRLNPQKQAPSEITRRTYPARKRRCEIKAFSEILTYLIVGCFTKQNQFLHHFKQRLPDKSKPACG
jgi:hypothetical protein